MEHSPAAVVDRLRPLLLAVHAALSAGVAVSAAVHAEHGWNPTADRHLDHQLVRREAMERLRPWGVSPDELSDPVLARQLELGGTDNLGLPMSGLILRTPTDVLRVWRSDDGELPAAATDGLRAFYRQRPSRQLQLDLGERPDAPRPHAGHLALLWADAGTVLTRFDLVRPCGHLGRRAHVDWHVDLLERLVHVVA